MTYTRFIEIEPTERRVKGKTYRYGEIRCTVPEHWVGIPAEVRVSIPLHVLSTEDVRKMMREHTLESQ